MTTIGIISDTHGLLRPEVVERLKTCDAILHAGDINKPEILDALRAIAPLWLVYTVPYLRVCLLNSSISGIAKLKKRSMSG